MSFRLPSIQTLPWFYDNSSFTLMTQAVFILLSGSGSILVGVRSCACCCCSFPPAQVWRMAAAWSFAAHPHHAHGAVLAVVLCSLWFHAHGARGQPCGERERGRSWEWGSQSVCKHHCFDTEAYGSVRESKGKAQQLLPRQSWQQAARPAPRLRCQGEAWPWPGAWSMHALVLSREGWTDLGAGAVVPQPWAPTTAAVQAERAWEQTALLPAPLVFL